MVLFSHIKRLQLLHELISEQKTNTPEVLAARLDISRASLYQLIDDLKKNNLPITYSRKKRSFIYTKTVNFLPSMYINGRNFTFAPVFREYKESCHSL